MALHVHDDNPAVEDLLGFDAVVTPVVEAIRRPSVAPLTVGIRGGWGSGKSTLLRLVEAELGCERDEPGSRFLILSVDPWEFESAEELRSTLVEMVLTEIRDRIGDDRTLAPKLGRLLARVRFGKIATAALKGLVTLPIDGGWSTLGLLVKGMAGGVDSFVAPAEEEEQGLPPTMHGFRREFGDLIGSIHGERNVDKVVVLVDDLDRCLPNAVVESLEAIKLFLSVDRMVFVIAADEALVRSAIGVSLAGSGRASDFADLYLEKIVQLPLSIPALTHDDAVTYATLLLSSEDEAFTTLCAYCDDRRRKHRLPLLDQAPHTSATELHERLARQVCDGLRADRMVNPRQIKRFLNNFAVRASVARARGIDLSPAVAAKLMLLEEQYLDTDFKILVETPAPEVRGLLRDWEAWGRGEPDASRPAQVSEGSKQWAGSPPSLADATEDLSAYLALAAAFIATTPGGLLTSKVARVVDAFLAAEDNEAARLNIRNVDMRSFDDAELEQVLLAISQRATGMRNPEYAVRLVVEISDQWPHVAAQAAALLEERLASCVTLGVSGLLATSTEAPIREAATRLASDGRVAEQARAALTAALGQQP